uniref:Reverse transcriptase zinc-binding domain-containing protein n=1 Tax=Lactuca sativa TaxID=4236 RepID=A0A9R1WME2_LACSA|nr:hypothetical protein LSAT_V11C100044600 [Lactuca sativa]
MCMLELGSGSFNSSSSRAFNESIPSSSRVARLTYTPTFKGGAIETLERIRRNFIWSKEYDKKKSLCWVAWEKLISPMNVGGIKLGSIKSLNISLLAKWMWRLKTDNSALLVNVIRSSKGVWKNITKYRSNLKNFNIDPKEVISWNSIDGRWESKFVSDGRFMVRQGDETSDHILLMCSMAMAVMDSILNWCEIRCDRFTLVNDMLLFISRWPRCNKKKNLLNMILCGALWCI